MSDGIKDFQALLDDAYMNTADRVVCDNYLSQEEGFSEEEREEHIKEYLSLHCVIDKCLYLCGETKLRCPGGFMDIDLKPVDHNVYIDGKPARASTDCVADVNKYPFGVCLKQTAEKMETIICEPKFAFDKWLECCSKMKVGDADSVNENSYLICLSGGGVVVRPVLETETEDELIDEYNIQKPLAELEFSPRAKRLLMILEIYGYYSYTKGYLVSENQHLSGIVGFRGEDKQNVTVAIGDALQGNEYLWYKDRLSVEGIDTSNLNSNGDFEGYTIPIDICIEKYLSDLETTQLGMKRNLKNTIKGRNENSDLIGDELIEKIEKDYGNIMLTQNQYDALIIARYQAGSLGDNISDYIIDGENDINKWEQEFKKISKVDGEELATRAAFETELFSGNYNDLSSECVGLPAEYYFDFTIFDLNE